MPNPVTRWQIVSPRPDQATAFYCELFGWQATHDRHMNHHIIATGSDRGIDGGVWPAPPEAPTFAQLFVEVDDCNAYVERARKLGASVLIPPQSLPNGEVMAILRDPGGMTFGVVQTAMA